MSVNYVPWFVALAIDVTFGARPALAQPQQDNPATRVHIVGHPDMQGATEHHLQVSKGREASVVDVFVKQHAIKSDRLAAEGVGAYAAGGDQPDRCGPPQEPACGDGVAVTETGRQPTSPTSRAVQRGSSTDRTATKAHAEPAPFDGLTASKC